MSCSGLILSVSLLATVAAAQEVTPAVEEPAVAEQAVITAEEPTVAVEKPAAVVKKMRYVENNNAIPVRRGQGKD